MPAIKREEPKNNSEVLEDIYVKVSKALGKENQKSYNGLTPAQVERLALVAEEAAEVIQIINKILRHGYESYHPMDEKKASNQFLLEKELGDLAYAVDLMMEKGDVNKDSVGMATETKSKKINTYLRYEENKGHILEYVCDTHDYRKL